MVLINIQCIRNGHVATSKNLTCERHCPCARATGAVCEAGVGSIFLLSGRKKLIYFDLRFCFSIHITDNIGHRYLICFGSLSLNFLISEYVVPNYLHCSCATQNLTFIHIAHSEILTHLKSISRGIFGSSPAVGYFVSSYRGHNIEFPISDFLSPSHLE